MYGQYFFEKDKAQTARIGLRQQIIFNSSPLCDGESKSLIIKCKELRRRLFIYL